MFCDDTSVAIIIIFSSICDTEIVHYNEKKIGDVLFKGSYSQLAISDQRREKLQFHLIFLKSKICLAICCKRAKAIERNEIRVEFLNFVSFLRIYIKRDC